MSNVMMRSLALLPLCAALTSACGDLSQEDLVFRAALPAKADLEVRPAGAAPADDVDGAGTDTQALLGAGCPEDPDAILPTDIKCHARNVSGGLNAITFLLLDIVDAVVKHPPTTRERGRRVWGPFFDFGKDNTARFEMKRINGGTEYEFCVHAVAGRIDDATAEDVTCATDIDDDSGLTRLLSGTLAPGDINGAGARSGTGSMVFELGRLPELAGVGRSMTITWDNGDERTDIDIVVDGTRDGLLERDPVEYSFTREADGAGTFGFVLFANFNDRGDDKPGLERLDIVAKWNSDEAGAGKARVTGGDFAPESVSVYQCWDAGDAEVYVRADITTQVEPLGEEGDVEQCVIDEDVVTALLPVL